MGEETETPPSRRDSVDDGAASTLGGHSGRRRGLILLLGLMLLAGISITTLADTEAGFSHRIVFFSPPGLDIDDTVAAPRALARIPPEEIVARSPILRDELEGALREGQLQVTVNPASTPASITVRVMAGSVAESKPLSGAFAAALARATRAEIRDRLRLPQARGERAELERWLRAGTTPAERLKLGISNPVVIP